MKRISETLIALSLTALIAVGASAEVSGNLSSGGAVAAGDNGVLYLTMEDGLYKLENTRYSSVASGTVLYAQEAEGVLYYVLREPVDGSDDELYTETVNVVEADGSTRRLGEARTYGREYEYAEDYSRMLSCTWYSGYTDLTAYAGKLYFVGSDGMPGSYTMRAVQWMDEENVENETEYASGNAIYCMDPQDGSLTEVVSGLGNGTVRMSIANDRIAVADVWQNSLFVYDPTDFRIYDIEGNLIREVVNASESRHTGFYTDDTEFTVLVNSLITDGEKIYASLGDSEGDYASASLVDVDRIDETIAYEAFYTDSVLADGKLVYLTSDVQNICWSELIEYTLTVRVRDGAQENVLAYIPKEYAASDMRLSVLDDMVYIRTGENILRVPMEGGEVQTLKDGVFEACPACAVENYGATDLSRLDMLEDIDSADALSEYVLPDSDTRLYTREELDIYDTDTLALIRNEILARHGYPFKKQKYRDYFSACSWYMRDENFAYGMLNEVEAENVETIKRIEAARKK